MISENDKRGLMSLSPYLKPFSTKVILSCTLPSQAKHVSPVSQLLFLLTLSRKFVFNTRGFLSETPFVTGYSGIMLHAGFKSLSLSLHFQMLDYKTDPYGSLSCEAAHSCLNVLLIFIDISNFKSDAG